MIGIKDRFADACTPRGQYFPLRGVFLHGGLSTVYLAIFQTNMEF